MQYIICLYIDTTTQTLMIRKLTCFLTKAQTRGDAHGSRRKLHKQKGTGRARVGDNRSAIR